METIESHAFHGLKNLKMLNLAVNTIKHLYMPMFEE